MFQHDIFFYNYPQAKKKKKKKSIQIQEFGQNMKHVITTVPCYNHLSVFQISFPDIQLKSMISIIIFSI